MTVWVLRASLAVAFVWACDGEREHANDRPEPFAGRAGESAASGREGGSAGASNSGDAGMVAVGGTTSAGTSSDAARGGEDESAGAPAFAGGGTGGSDVGGAPSSSAGAITMGGTPSQCADAEGAAGADGSETERPPSCQGLAENCGPCQNESCCASRLVPGGSFLRSYDGDVYVEQTWPATVSDFRLDRFEVTVGRFRPFVDAVIAGWRPPAGSGKHVHLNGGLGITGDVGWKSEDWNDWLAKTKEAWDDDSHLGCDTELPTWTPEPGPNENHAITCVSWVAAYAFCIWDGGFLPTEAEWNYAAAGGDEQREYPWGGADPAPDRAVYYCRSGGTPGCTWPVGSRPAGDGRFGHADLAGNAWEWVLDSANMLSVSWSTCASGTPCTEYPIADCNDCGYFAETFARVMRGGSNTDAPKNVRASLRHRSGFLDAVNDLGFRCARAP